jgi:hypothetical protein
MLPIRGNVRKRLPALDAFFGAKVLRPLADYIAMINSVRSTPSTPEPQNARPAAKPPQPPQSTSAQDKVTLKSAGDKDHDGDSQ